MDSSPLPALSALSAAAAQPEQGTEEGSIPECPVCYLSYDNALHTPLLLPCRHTFCLECLAKLCAFLKQSQGFRCPLCRECVPLPSGGIPRLPANLEIVRQLPPQMQELQDVWLQGLCLCWREEGDWGGPAAEQLVTVDLYPATPQTADAEGLVATQHPASTCWALLCTCWVLCCMCCEMCGFLWEHYPAAFRAAALLVLGVLLPLAMIFVLRQHV